MTIQSSPGVEIAWFDGGDVLGEGPYWLPMLRRLYWLDIIDHEVHCLDAEGLHVVVKTPQKIHAIALCHFPWFVCTAHHLGLAWLNVESGLLVPYRDPELDHKRFILNDGRCDPAGRFWFGSFSKPDLPESSVFRVGADAVVHREFKGLRASNGLAFTPDGRRMYLADTHRGIFGFDVDPSDGIVGAPQMLRPAEIGDPNGLPDGMTIDDQGCLWVAMVRGGQVLRLTPNGQVDRSITLPCSNVMSCGFGGDRLDTLFVTTGRIGLTEQQLAAQPQSGAVFAVHTGYRGIAEVPYVGTPPANMPAA